MFGFTLDTSGANLPAELAPWRKLANGVQTGPGNPQTGRPSSEHVAEAVGREGFYVAKSPSSVEISKKILRRH